MKLSNNVIIAKSKAIYGNFLKVDDYHRMIKLRSLSDLVGFLKKQANYQNILKDVHENSIHRGQLEAFIKKNAFNHIIRLIKMVHSSDESFYRLNLITQENQIILSIIRDLISDKPQEITEKLTLFFDVHTKINMTQLSKVETFDDLLKAIEKAPQYQILKKFYVKNMNDLKYLDVEHALESYYFDTAFERINKHFKGKTKDDLENIYKTRIELSNIIKIYRLKKFYDASPEVIKSVLIKKHTRINEKRINEIIHLNNPDEILKFLSKSEFSRFTSDKDYVYVEYYAEKIRYDLAKKFMYFSKDVAKVYTAFVTLADIEVENIINIIEGIRYQVDENEMKQMLIY